MPDRRILVLGASGMLGSCVSRVAGERGDLDLHLSVGRSRPPSVPGAKTHRLDLRKPEATRTFLNELRPDCVINCAGIVKSICENGEEAASINTLLPHLIAAAISTWHGRLLHISTDCVFSGNRGRYSESDIPDPVDLYGRTKLAGEVTTPPHLTVRTSFIGMEGGPPKGLLGWFLAQHGTVTGYRNAIWSGLTADALAPIVVDLALRSDVTGLVHVCGEAIDKYSLLCRLADVFDKRDIDIRGVDEPRCDRSMVSGRLASLGIVVPSMSEMLTPLGAHDSAAMRSPATS